MNKKIIIIILFVFASFFTLTYDAYADYQARVVSTTPCKLYKDQKGKSATGSCIYSNNKFNDLTDGPYWVDVGDQLKVITSKSAIKAPSSGYGSECKSTFLYISIDYGSKTYNGYVCKDNLWNGVITDAMKKEFKAAGFPESYYSNLALLRTAHPNWKFVAINLNLDFDDAVKNEDKGNKSLIQWTSSVNDVGYLSTRNSDYDWATDKYHIYDGSNWYAANSQTIAYYMDPRNFLSDNYIFQFETIAYQKSNYHLDIINALLKGQYISRYANNFVSAGAKADVNPIYLAALSKQEIGGTKANTGITGEKFTYGGKTYSGLYNFYNIGATSGQGAVYRGLVYANGSATGQDKTFSRPWRDPDTAILGGAQFINGRYIQTGQNTSYFKKWNVVYNYAKSHGLKPSANYTNQYMQNIEAPKSEAYSTYKSYHELGLLSSDFTFYIPVYNNMPVRTALPKKGSPNNYLKNLKVTLDGKTTNLSSDFNGSTDEYDVYAGSNVKSAKISATAVNSNAKISGTGTKNLVTGNNNVVITVTAQNGDQKKYTINIKKEPSNGEVVYKKISEIIKGAKITTDGTYITGLSFNTSIASMRNSIDSVDSRANVVIKRRNKEISSGNLVTGDTLTIVSGSETKTYSIVLYGDLNGDGKISIVDLLKTQKHLLGTTKLSGAYAKAADVNKDGKITAIDLLKVQKHILGDSLISQK